MSDATQRAVNKIYEALETLPHVGEVDFTEGLLIADALAALKVLEDENERLVELAAGAINDELWRDKEAAAERADTLTQAIEQALDSAGTPYGVKAFLRAALTADTQDFE